MRLEVLYIVMFRSYFGVFLCCWYTVCEWDVKTESTIGSDHFPVMCNVDLDACFPKRELVLNWCFDKTNWELFFTLSVKRRVRNCQWKGR